MKTKLSVFALFCCLSLLSTAQIHVQLYQHEITCDIDALADLPTIAATSPQGKVDITYDEKIYSGGCLGTLVRTFKYVNAAGETGEAMQIVHITDHQAPRMLGEAPNITTTRDMIPEPAQFAAVDNSGESFDVIFKEVKSEQRITRLWTCTDSCGNIARHTQIIALE